MRVVPAQEILDKIERGEPVEYDHVIVKGDLDLGKLDLPKRRVERTPWEIRLGLPENVAVVPSSISVTDSTIAGSVYFNNTIFDGEVGFRNSLFGGYSSFRGSSFRRDANFRGSSFSGDANFFISSFRQNTNFMDSSFNNYANFDNSVFKGAANFENTSFRDSAFFYDSHFNGKADFGHSSFNGLTGFDGSSFNYTANFMGSFFGDDVHFIGSSFNGIAIFDASSFNDSADFSYSSFSDMVDFSYSLFNSATDFSDSSFYISSFLSSQFNEQVTFDDSQFNGPTSFSSTLFKQDASFEGADFNGILYLDRAKYDKLYISWKNIKGLGYDDAAYLALLENFKKLGYFEDYDACYYDYRRLHREQDWSGRYHAMHPTEEWIRKRIDVLLGAFYGYGKKPLWPLLWSAGTIILFGIIWSVAGMNGSRGKNGRGIFERFGQQNATLRSERQGLLGGARVLADALLFSATVFLSGTRLFVEPPAQPEVRGLSANRVKWAMIVERVLGAFFSILFFLAISGTVVR